MFRSPGQRRPGNCTIDLGFAISDRFWVATGVEPTSVYVSCSQNAGSATKLDCFRFDQTGLSRAGDIMVLVY